MLLSLPRSRRKRRVSDVIEKVPGLRVKVAKERVGSTVLQREEKNRREGIKWEVFTGPAQTLADCKDRLARSQSQMLEKVRC